MVSHLSFLTGAFLVLSWTPDTVATPSPVSVGSDFQILLHNDIYGNSSTRNASVIVLGTPKTASDAQKACAALSETLWTPTNLSDDVFLPYLAYQAQAGATNGTYAPNISSNGGLGYGEPFRIRPSNDQPYFVAGNGFDGTCKAVSPSGKVQYLSCSKKLPALCSQSAPLSGFSFEPNTAQYQTQVSSGNATYTGFRDKLSFRFLGIRYAALPTRFTHSALYNASGTQSALDFGNTCAQSNGGAEDCLFLNVWTPYLPSSNNNSTALKPVMMWIHGGSYTSGSGSDPTFDGGSLASRGDVVVVSINYRLGALGFFTLPKMGINGNYAIGDQVTALKWIQANIKSFGGDPNRVTVAGQSAGAAATLALLRSPPASGLFSGAILMSAPQGPLTGVSRYTTYLTPLQEMKAQSVSVLNDTGCTQSSQAAQLACLRAYNPNDLVKLSTVNNVVVDGTYVITNKVVWNHTHVNSVPLMVGNMRDDAAPFVKDIDTIDLADSLTKNGLPAAKIIYSKAFPIPVGLNVTSSIRNVTVRASTDGLFRCGDLAMGYAAAFTKAFPITYYYEFNRSYQVRYWDPNNDCTAPVQPGYPNGNPNAEYYKCHSGDIQYVFGTWMRWNLAERDENDVPFTQFIIDTWASFVRTHNPVPDAGFLNARGFVNTTKEMMLGGNSTWAPVGAGSGQQTYRQLQWPSFQAAFKESAQCKVLGFPLNSFL